LNTERVKVFVDAIRPHAVGLTQECAARMSLVAARNILNFFDGRLDPRLVINPSVLQR
jgi:D-3-phosphoglycerate dehydrogenase / 2-oxoglutarate reductase